MVAIYTYSFFNIPGEFVISRQETYNAKGLF